MKDNKVCTNCGKELKEDSLFCPNCGTKVENVEAVTSDAKPRRGRPRKVDINKDEEKIEEYIKDVREKVKDKEEIQDKAEIKDNEEVKAKEIEEDSGWIKEANSDNGYPDSREIFKSELDNRQGLDDKQKKFIYPVIAVVVTFALCLVAFACFYQYYLKNLVIETTKREVTVTDTGISEAVEKVYDAVVVVESYSNNRLYSTGTGFVYKTDDKAGYILTNNHVIEGADKVRVVFTNNEKVEVDIVGSDAYSDVALLGVDKDKVISVAEIGSSEDLKVGDTSFAVGAPLDSATYAWTVTRGIVSGKNRTVSISSSNGVAGQVMRVLQTDTAINSGNSGGPLCNSNGQVIGITNMKLASSAVEGMGFAIPIETAVKYADKFIKGEKILYPYIGVVIADATPTYRDPNASGVYVQSVEKNSPAEKGGLRAGDKILKVNDTEIESSSFFKYELYKYDIGDSITIVVEREGKTKELTITLGSTGMNT